MSRTPATRGGEKRQRSLRPSAALVLGILSGLLASVAVVPTIFPLTYRVVSTEERSVLDQVTGASVTAATLHELGEVPPVGLAGRMAVDGIAILDATGNLTHRDGTTPEAELLWQICQDTKQQRRGYEVVDAERWATACYATVGEYVVAVKKPNQGSGTFVGRLVLGLAAMVGISTAIGVLQLLSPISEVSATLARVSAGERGVRASSTGLAELDDLVDQLNAAAQAMEDREDAIEGRIRVVQEMARLVAHEVRNPLQSLELLASLIASEDDREERDALAESIHQEVRTLENVVGRMLRNSESGAALTVQRKPHEVRSLIENVLTFRRPEARHNGIRLEAGPLAEATVPLDRTLARRAVENLVSNAMKMVKPGDGQVRVSAESNETHVCIVVDDNGPGVDPALGDTIYQPEVSGRPGGMGLGLPLVMGVTRAHDGYVEHERSPLGGARFRAWFAKQPQDGGGSVADPRGG
jgi:signal transduction histidine kinase